METKLSKVKNLYMAGDFRGALRLAAKFGDLGAHRKAILEAHESYHSAAFYKQLGRDIDALQIAGRNALAERYGWPSPASVASGK